MSQDRLIIAIGRIERALWRIEQKSATLLSSGDKNFQTKHEHLKSAARDALFEIDAFIDGQSR